MTTTTRSETLLKFMTDAAAGDGTYEVTDLTDEQLAVFLPWLFNKAITWAHKNKHCEVVNAALHSIVAGPGEQIDRYDAPKYYSAAGYDCYGHNREGFNERGLDQNGFDREGFNADGYSRGGFNRQGFNYYGLDKDGFNIHGRNRAGQTRAEVAASLVVGWSPEYLAAVAAKLKERKAAEEAAAEVRVEALDTVGAAA